MSLPKSGEKAFIKTFGCQMNVYDTQRISEALSEEGYSQTSDMHDADLIILNTCHIREKATEKVYSDLGRINEIKATRLKVGKKTLVTVAGCVAQAEGAEIFKRSKGVDIVVGPQSYQSLPKILSKVKLTGQRIQEIDFQHREKFASLSHEREYSSPSAFLTIQEGCNKFCTFCVVPYTRGVEYSRSISEIEKEARSLVQKGVREVTLLGQNVNAYHGLSEENVQSSLAHLINRLAQIQGLERLRYTTSHPLDMSDDLVLAHRDEAKLMPYLHLPFQSGSDKILRGMNRKHTCADYIRIIEQIRHVRSDIALSTDVIVGFPEETDEDFEKTLELVRSIKFAHSFCFKYSPRPGTPAAALKSQVNDDVKSERLYRLQSLLQEQHEIYNNQFIGRTLPVLFEKAGAEEGIFVGRSPYFQLVLAEANYPMKGIVGQVLPVKILKSGPGSLSGIIEV